VHAVSSHQAEDDKEYNNEQQDCTEKTQTLQAEMKPALVDGIIGANRQHEGNGGHQNSEMFAFLEFLFQCNTHHRPKEKEQQRENDPV